MQKKRNWSIKYNLLILVMIVVIPAILIMIITAREHQRRQYSDAIDGINIVVENMVKQQDLLIKNTGTLLTVMAEVYNNKALKPERFSGLLSALVLQNNYYTIFFAASPTGNVFASTTDKLNYSVADRRYFQEGLSGKYFFSAGEYAVSRGTGKPTLHFALPVINYSDQINAVIVAGFDLDYYDKMFGNNNLPEGSTVTIFDRNGVILYRNLNKAANVGKVCSPELLNNIRTGAIKGNFLARGSDKVQRFYAYQKVQLRPGVDPYLYIAVGIPERALFAETNYYLVRDLIVLLLVIFSIMILSWFGIDFVMINRIKQIVDHARRIGAGDLASRLVLSGRNDELAGVAGAFNQMAEALEAREKGRCEAVADLQSLQVELELRVRQRTNALLEATSKFSSIFMNSPISIVLVDLQSNSFVDVNDSFLNALGYERNEVVNKTSDEIDIWCSQDVRSKFFSALNISGSVNNMEVRFKTKQGVELTTLFSATIIQVSGVPFILAFTVDISDRAAMEAELLNTRKLESVGLLAGGIAHDFNNLLTAITGNISLARELVINNSVEKAQLKLSAAENAADRARALASRLLTFAKGGAPVKRLSNLAALIREVADFALSGSNVKPEYYIEAELFSSEFDEGQLSQVINNLVINAKQAMADGGIISLSLSNKIVMEFDTTPLMPGKYLLIRIADQGVGIPQENLDRIFDPYFTTKTNGSGLGLASVYSIIKKHEGFSSVDSQVGVGTVFELLLPAFSKNIVNDLPVVEQVLMQGTWRILIMDDVDSVREVAQEMLESLGYEVTATADGEAAVRAYSDALTTGKRFDAVVMDLTVPGGMGGKDALDEMLKIDPEVVAFVSSGYSDDQIMTDFRAYNFKGIISKPYKLQDISSMLYNYLNAAENAET